MATIYLVVDEDNHPIAVRRVENPSLLTQGKSAYGIFAVVKEVATRSANTIPTFGYDKYLAYTRVRDSPTFPEANKAAALEVIDNTYPGLDTFVRAPVGAVAIDGTILGTVVSDGANVPMGRPVIITFVDP